MPFNFLSAPPGGVGSRFDPSGKVKDMRDSLSSAMRAANPNIPATAVRGGGSGVVTFGTKKLKGTSRPRALAEGLRKKETGRTITFVN